MSNWIIAVIAAGLIVSYFTGKGRVFPGAGGGGDGILMWGILSGFIILAWYIGLEAGAEPYHDFLWLHCEETAKKLICDKYALPINPQ